MRSIHDWLEAYGESHQNKFNKTMHWICVPTIFVSLIGLLSLIPTPFQSVGGYIQPYLHMGTVLLIFGLLFYLRLSFPITIGMLVVAVASLMLVVYVNQQYQSIAGWVYFTAFALAWIGQFIGHKVEGKKPSFFDDLKFLLIGPAWLLSFVFRKLGIEY